MSPNDNRRAGQQPGHGGGIPSSRDGAKVIPLHPGRQASPTLDGLTARLVLAQYRAGTLPEAVIVAMMASAGLRP